MLTYDKFEGYSEVNEPSKLASGTLVKGSKNIDLTRRLGALMKRYGTEAQIPSLGAGGVKGLHTYRRTSGDRIVFGHGTSLYRLTGQTSSLVKTTTADFDLGTKEGVITTSNEVKLQVTGTESLDQQQTNFDTSQSSNSTESQGQTFKPQRHAISAIEIYSSSSGSTDTLTLTLYTDTTKTKSLGSKSISSTGKISTLKFNFDSPIAVTKDQTYYFEIRSTGTFGLYLTASDYYANGARVLNGTVTSGDLWFKTYGSDSFYSTNGGKWISPAYDLGITPSNSLLNWNELTPRPNNTSMTILTRGSSDNQSWGNWQMTTKGGGIPLTRYVQVSVEFTTTGGATPVLYDFTINYETAFTQATNLKSGMTGSTIRSIDWKDQMYFTDGGRPQRYDGTNIRSLGVGPPTTAPTLATSGTGLTGTYRCVVTYVNELGAESNAGPHAQITLSNQGINWSNIPVGPAGTTKRNLYRTKANGSLYFYVTTLDNNTATTHTGDNVIDTNLVIPMETDNNIPPNASIIYEHKNYMMYATGDRLYFSKVNKPDNVPSTAYRSFPGNILAVREYQDALIVSGDQFVTAVIGDIWDKDPNIDTTYTRTISEGFGSLSHEATVKAYSPEGDILVFPTRLGLSYITPGLQENSVKSIPMSYDVQPIFDMAVNKGNMAAVYSNNCLYLALNFFGTDTPIQTNNIILVLDLRTSKWCPPWTIPSAGFCIANGKVYFGSPTEGRIFELNKGTSDNGQPIHAVAKLRVDQFTGKKRTKFKRIRLALTENSDVTSLVIKANVDGVDNIIPANVLKTPNITDRFRLQEKKGYQYQVTLEDNSTRDWGVTEIATEVK